MTHIEAERHNETPNDSPWYDVEEAAHYIKAGRRMVYAEVSRGKLRAARIGARGQLRFHRSWLDGYLSGCAPVNRFNEK
jgi:excisionase family DNA binding protein